MARGSERRRSEYLYVRRRLLPAALFTAAILLFAFAFLPGSSLPGSGRVIPLTSSTIIATGLVIGLVFAITGFLVERAARRS